MELEEKFRPHVKLWDYSNDVPEEENHAAKCVEIAEEFAVGFAVWCDNLQPHQRVTVWSKNGEYKGLFTMDNEQLMEKYKQSLKQSNNGK